jgi:hypothetical protein
MSSQLSPTGPRVAAYLRCSKSDQSHDSQRVAILAGAERLGVRISRWYIDVGSRHRDRPEWQALMEDVAARKVQWVVVSEDDRAGTRSGYDWGRWADHMLRYGCRMWDLSTGRVLNAEDGMTQITGAVARVRSRDEQLSRAKRSIRGRLAAAQRNEWQGGGSLAFGAALLCTAGWRVEFCGKGRFLKVWPDGREEAYAQIPARERGEVFLVVRSRYQERLAAVRQLFTWFFQERLNYSQAARRMNALVPHHTADTWTSRLVNHTLRNPWYVEGGVVAHRKSCGTIMEFRGGELTELPHDPLGSRPVPQEEWVVPSQGLDEPLIDRQTWETVQQNLAGKHITRKAAKNPLHVLAGLLYCGSCSGRMPGWDLTNNGGGLCFTCPTFKRHGNNNPYGCKLNRVRQDTILPLLDAWLEAEGIAIATCLEAPALPAGEATRSCWRDKTLAYHRLWAQLHALVPTIEVDGEVYELDTPQGAYEKQHGARDRAMAAELEEKTAQLEAMVDAYPSLPSPMARDIANRKIQGLEAEIESLKAQCQPLDQRLLILRSEMVEASDRLREAQNASQDRPARQRALALARVIRRIDCFFRTEYWGPSRQCRQFLVRAVITTTEGEQVELTPPAAS